MSDFLSIESIRPCKIEIDIKTKSKEFQIRKRLIELDNSA